MMDIPISKMASFFKPTFDLEPLDLPIIKRELCRQISLCQLRGLHETCKWLGDLHVALDGVASLDDVETICQAMKEISPHFGRYSLAKSYFDTREYDRCAHVLSEVSDSPLLYFIQMFSKYLSSEKKCAEDEIDLRSCDKKIQQSNILWIKRELESHMRKCELDAYCQYLYGVVLKKLNLTGAAIQSLCIAVSKDNTLWCAWYELSTLMKNKEMVNALKVPMCWMKYFFEGRVYLDLHEKERAMDVFMKLTESGFEASANLKTDLAITYDAMKRMDAAVKQFEAVADCDPYRLDGMDVYSNVLFVKEQHEKLAYLTHHCVRVDKYRPQTCCVIGNFYSLRGQHDKAVLYFQRALKLRPAYSLVWILVGHEYMELRNTNAAVQAYQKAIEHNSRDYRAWYGLGQMYDILKMPRYTLYYYQEALCLQPTDSRLAVALGETYERLNRLDEAKKCFWRAYAVGDLEGNALIRLAKCYEKCTEKDEAAAAYTEFIKHCERKGLTFDHNRFDMLLTSVTVICTLPPNAYGQAIKDGLIHLPIKDSVIRDLTHLSDLINI